MQPGTRVAPLWSPPSSPRLRLAAASRRGRRRRSPRLALCVARQVDRRASRAPAEATLRRMPLETLTNNGYTSSHTAIATAIAVALVLLGRPRRWLAACSSPSAGAHRPRPHAPRRPLGCSTSSAARPRCGRGHRRRLLAGLPPTGPVRRPAPTTSWSSPPSTSATAGPGTASTPGRSGPAGRRRPARSPRRRRARRAGGVRVPEPVPRRRPPRLRAEPAAAAGARAASGAPSTCAMTASGSSTTSPAGTATAPDVPGSPPRASPRSRASAPTSASRCVGTGTELEFVNTHLDERAPGQPASERRAAGVVARADSPAIVVGDLNATAADDPGCSSGLEDAELRRRPPRRRPPAPPTTTAAAPTTRRLDHIFVASTSSSSIPASWPTSAPGASPSTTGRWSPASPPWDSRAAAEPPGGESRARSAAPERAGLLAELRRQRPAPCGRLAAANATSPSRRRTGASNIPHLHQPTAHHDDFGVVRWPRGCRCRGPPTRPTPRPPRSRRRRRRRRPSRRLAPHRRRHRPRPAWRLPRAPRQARTGREALPAPLRPAGARRAVGVDDHVAELAGEAVDPVAHGAADDGGAADARAEGDEEGVVDPPGGADLLLGPRGRGGVVLDGDGPARALGQPSREVVAVEAREVRAGPQHAGAVDQAGDADPDRRHPAVAAPLLGQVAEGGDRPSAVSGRATLASAVTVPSASRATASSLVPPMSAPMAEGRRDTGAGRRSAPSRRGRRCRCRCRPGSPVGWRRRWRPRRRRRRAPSGGRRRGERGPTAARTPEAGHRQPSSA